MKYLTIVFLSITLLAVLGCSALESAIDEIPLPTQLATAAPSGETNVSPAATPEPQGDPDSSITQDQQPTTVPEPTATAAQEATQTPDAPAPDPQQATTAPDIAVPPVDQPAATPAPTGSDTPSPTAAPTASPADPSTPDANVVELTPIPEVAPEAEAPAVPRQLTNSPGDELDPAWDPKAGPLPI